MLSMQNVTQTKCTMTNCSILRKCTIQNVTDLDFFFIDRFKEREVSISDLHLMMTCIRLKPRVGIFLSWIIIL